MNIDAWVRSRIASGEEATVSLLVLEKEFGGFWTESRIKQWAERLSKELGIKSTIHWASDVVTFYPK
jgi:hypothetical protein